MKQLFRLIIIIVFGFYGCYPANRISLIQPERQLDDICAINTRVVVLQSYAFNVGFTIYHLPYGNYYPEGQDENGIYYRAPIPIVATGFSGTEEFVQSGIYLLGKSLNISSPFGTFIYFNDDG